MFEWLGLLLALIDAFFELLGKLWISLTILYALYVIKRLAEQ